MIKNAPAIDEKTLYGLVEAQKKKYNFLLQKKRKRAPEQSSISKIIAELAKKKIRDATKVKNFLNAKYDELTEDNISLYTAIAGSRVKNGKLILSEKICKKPLSTDYYFWNLECRCVTNDTLMMESIYIKQQEKLSGYTQRICDCGDVSWMRIVSNSYEMKGKVERGYYQDFDGQYAFIGFDLVDDDFKNKMLSLDESIEFADFYMENVKYNVFGNNTACMIVPEAASKEEVAAKYEAMKIISPKKNNYVIDIKSSTMNNKIKFLDTKFHKESFCPAFLYLPETFITNVQIHVEYNYNELFQTYSDLLKKGNNIHLPANTFYWDSMDDFMRFLAIMCLTLIELNEESKTKLARWYDTYILYKDAFLYASRIYPVIVDIFVTFYMSFVTKIDYDKLTSMEKKAHECLSQLEIFRRMPEKQKMLDLLEEMGNASQNMLRQLSDEVYEIFKECVGCIDKLLAGSGRNLVDELTIVCRKIYMLTYCNEEGFIGCIPRLLPAGGFLAGIGGGAPIDKNILKKKLKIKFEKKEMIEREEKKRIADMSNILNHLGAYQEKVVQNTINKFIPTTDENYIAKREYVAKALREGIGKDTEARDFINGRIVEVVQAKGDITDEYLDNKDFVEKYINLYREMEDKKEEKRKAAIREEEAKIAESKGKIKSMKKKDDVLLYEDEKDDIEMDDEISITKKKKRKKEKKLPPLDMSNAAKDTADFINDYHAYVNGGASTPLSVDGTDVRSMTAKGGKVHNYLAAMIYSSNVYGIPFKDLKRIEPISMVRKYPISYRILNSLIANGFPTPKQYLLESKSLSHHEIKGDHKVQKSINDEYLAAGDPHTGDISSVPA